MSISFHGRPPLQFEGGHIICRLTDKFLANVWSFDVFCDILLTFPTIKKFDRSHLVDVLMPDYRMMYPHVSETNWEEIVGMTEEVYAFSQEEFDQFRGDLLEYLLSQLGAIKVLFPSSYVTIKDCRIYDENGRLGEKEGHPDTNMDVAFYMGDPEMKLETIYCELLECKAKLDNYLAIVEDRDPPIKQKTKEKLDYLNFINRYFSSCTNFSISFATFQENADRCLHALKRLNINGIGIINRSEIVDKISHY